VPLEQLWAQARILTRARSLTVHLFNRQTHGQVRGHAQGRVANLPFEIDVICKWTEGTKRPQTALKAVLPQSSHTEPE
jgi:hypothetical protein